MPHVLHTTCCSIPEFYYALLCLLSVVITAMRIILVFRITLSFTRLEIVWQINTLIWPSVDTALNSVHYSCIAVNYNLFLVI